MKVRNFDIQTFYTKSEGGLFIETLRNEWKKTYDYTLIDSRTGITDIGGICTIQLPDVLVLLFTATKQSFHGAISVAEKATAARQKLPYDRLNLITIPIPSRFDSQTEFKLSQEWLERFSRDLSQIYSNWLPKSVSKLAMLQITQIPCVSYFSYGEKLPVLEQGTISPTGLGYAYETLAALIAHNFEHVAQLPDSRDEFVKLAAKAEPGQHIYRKVRIFVASPGDVVDERNRVKLVVEELNRSVAHRLRLKLEILDWRTHVGPAIGRSEDVMLEQMPIEEGDIFIGILWARFGTPSGTIDPLSGKYPSLYQTYETVEDFEHRVREHIIKAIFEYTKERLSRNFQPDLAKELDKLAADSIR